MTHDSATVLLLKPSGKMLMQLRDDGNGKTIPYPNMWNFLGGAIEGTETDRQAAVREVEEETTIRIEESDLVEIFTYSHDKTAADHIFVCHVSEDTAAEVHEGAALQWLTFDEITQVELGFEQAKILPSLKQYLENF